MKMIAPIARSICGLARLAPRVACVLLIAGVAFAWTPAPARATLLCTVCGAAGAHDHDGHDHDGHDHLFNENLIEAPSGGPSAGNWVGAGTTPGKWGPADPVTGLTTITYSFATGLGYSTSEASSGGSVVALESFMPFTKAVIEAEIRRALDAWEAVANILFVELPDDGAPFNAAVTASGDIRIGGHAFDGVGGTVSHGYYAPVNGASAAGDVHFDVAETWKIGFGGTGYDIFQSFAHEVGHSLGLGHSSSPLALMQSGYSELFSGPQADDILGMSTLYPFPVVQTPEPASWLLAALAAAVVFQARRRRS
jgi:hypothetical protein